MQYCEKHDLVIDPLHESCPLCDAEEKREEILRLRAEVKQLRKELADAQNEGARQVILALADALEEEGE